MDNLEKETFELFGEMRDATKEECLSIENHIKSISKPTGITFDDLMDEESKINKTNKIF